MNEPSNRPGGQSVCPASHGGLLAARIRRLVHNPDKILASLVHEGDTVLDIGCGPGFFTLKMARMVGEQGRVIAADLQQGMLDMLADRARRVGLESRVRLHKCESDSIGLDEQVDFALAFYMLHELPDPAASLREIHSLLKPDGKFLMVEPKFHVSAPAFEATVDLARAAGFRLLDSPRVAVSRSALFASE